MKKLIEISTLDDLKACAKKVNVDGWACAHCGLFYGNTEDSEMHARYCCTRVSECHTCGGLSQPHRAYCDACELDHVHEAFQQLEEVDWDGQTPLCIFRGDEYFFDPEGLELFLDGHCIPIDDLRLVICKPQELPVFEMNEYLEDYTPLEDDFFELPKGWQEAEKAVNDYLKKCGHFCWYGGNKRVSTKSLKEYVSEHLWDVSDDQLDGEEK